MSITSIDGSANTPAVQQPSALRSDWQNMLTSAASSLGLSTSAAQQQQSGFSLGSIAQSQGVSQQSLVSTISAALTKSDPSLPASQAQQIATGIANRTHGAGGHHHHHATGATESSGQSWESTLLAALGDDSSSSSDNDPLIAALTSDPSSTDGLPLTATGSSTSTTDPVISLLTTTDPASNNDPLVTSLSNSSSTQVTNSSSG